MVFENLRALALRVAEILKGCKTYENGENRVKNFYHSRKIQNKLVYVKISAQNNFGNSSKVDFKFLVPLAATQTQNSKGRQFFKGGNDLV